MPALLLSISFHVVSAQYLYDLGFGAGLSSYAGEVSGSPFNSPGYALEAYYRYNINSRVALKFDASYGSFDGTTSDGNNSYLGAPKMMDYADLVLDSYSGLNSLEDYSFTNNFFSAEMLLEINFFPYPYKKSLPNSSNFSPFAFVGLGMQSYTTVATINNTMGPEEKSVAMSIPFGVGVKWMFSERFGVQYHFKTVKLFADNFDTSQLDDPFDYANTGVHRHDWLFTSTISLFYSFGEDIWDCNCPSRFVK